MSSNQSNENVEEHLAMQAEILDIDARLAKLNCPFNWNTKIPHCSVDEDEEKLLKEDKERLLNENEERFQMYLDREEYLPEQIFVYLLKKAMKNTKKNELSSALECVNKAQESLAAIVQKGTFKDVENVLLHLFNGTKCHVLKELGRLTEVARLLQGICDIDIENKKELAMLNACLCMAWSKRTITDSLEATNFAMKAVEYDPANGNWHYLLGKKLRSFRRRHNSLGSPPSQEETLAFQEAYKLSKNVLFGVSLAQMYRESSNHDMANKIYEEVHALQPTSCTVRFHLALGFIRTKKCVLAKECLDYIAERMPESSRYAHYMGIYHEKCTQSLETALPYYKSTTEKLNWVAERQYMECRKRVEVDWDPLLYILNLSSKYKLFRDHTIHEMNVFIGSYYLFEMHDVVSACQYLDKAIEANPESKRIKEHSKLFHSSEKVNIYHVLVKKIQNALENGDVVYEDDKIAVLKRTLELCRRNSSNVPSPSPSPQEQSKPKSSRLSSGYRNHDQGSSSRAQSNWRKDRQSSPSRNFSGNYSPRSTGGLNSGQGNFRPSHKKDYTSWRSNKRPAQSSRSEHRISNSFEERNDLVSTARTRDGRVEQTATPANPRDKNDDSEAGASCSLVKTLENHNI